MIIEVIYRISPALMSAEYFSFRRSFTVERSTIITRAPRRGNDTGRHSRHRKGVVFTYTHAAIISSPLRVPTWPNKYHS